jgi:uncharacterized membrane protein
MSDTLHDLERHFSLPHIRRVPLDRPFQWLLLGWEDLRANPVASLAYGLLFAIAGDVILLLALPHPHLFTLAVSGFFLVAPILAAGLYEISRRHARGEPSTFFDTFGGFKRNGESLALFGLLLAIMAIAWERLSAILFALFLSGDIADVGQFVEEVFFSGQHTGFVMAWFVVGGSLAVFVFAVSAVSVPMLLDREVDFATAAMTSFKAVSSNLRAMTLWAAIIVGLTLVGFATLLFGLIVIMPIIGHATWHAYRELVE